MRAIITTIFFTALIFYLFIFMAAVTYAHPGRTASDGCHYCRTNCDDWGVAWNVRHCHNGAIFDTPTQNVSTPTPTKILTPTSTPIKKILTPSPTPEPTYTQTPTPTSQIVITLSPTNPPSPSPEVKGETTQGGSATDWLVGAGIGSFVLWKFIKWMDSKAPDIKA